MAAPSSGRHAGDDHANRVTPLSETQLDRTLLYWALLLSVYVQSEDRVKSKEVVISRADLSVVALYHPAPGIGDTTVVLVREFRSPAPTPDGSVHEVPGGSGST
jgi:hypothetical protein